MNEWEVYGVEKDGFRPLLGYVYTMNTDRAEALELARKTIRGAESVYLNE